MRDGRDKNREGWKGQLVSSKFDLNFFFVMEATELWGCKLRAFHEKFVRLFGIVDMASRGQQKLDLMKIEDSYSNSYLPAGVVSPRPKFL